MNDDGAFLGVVYVRLVVRLRFSYYMWLLWNYWSTNPMIRMYILMLDTAMKWSGVSNETNEDVRMYIEEYLF